MLIFGRWNFDSAFPTSLTEAILPKIEPQKIKTLPESAGPFEKNKLRFLRAQKELDKILEILGPHTAPWGQCNFFMVI